MVQSLVMCLRPGTPKILTEPVSFGVIDPSRRVTRAELDRLDRLWREKHQRNGTALQAVTSNNNKNCNNNNSNSRASIESDMTRVEGRDYSTINRVEVAERQMNVGLSELASTNSRTRGNSVKTWLFPRKQQQANVVAW